MKKLKLYLDDVRTPIDEEWCVVRSYNDFVNFINKNGLGNIDVISLDHDLGDEAMTEYYTNVKNNYQLTYDNIKEKTGYDCCKYLVNLCIDYEISLPQIYVHSGNPIGAANMMGYINNYLKICDLPQSCVHVEIPHSVEESHQMTKEERIAKWDKTKNKKPLV